MSPRSMNHTDVSYLVYAAQAGNRNAQEGLLRQFDPVLRRAAGHYCCSGNRGRWNFEDLYGDARLAFLMALRTFKAERGSFPGYVYKAMCHECSRCAPRYHQAFSVSRNDQVWLSRLLRSRSAFRREHGRAPDTVEWAEYSGCPLGVLLDITATYTVIPWDSEVVDPLTDERICAEMTISIRDQMLAACISELSPLERQVICRHYGVCGETETTLSAIARDVGVSLSTIHRAEQRAIASLRGMLTEYA